MSNRGIDARSFWEQKILVWERDRYGGEYGALYGLKPMISSAESLVVP